MFSCRTVIEDDTVYQCLKKKLRLLVKVTVIDLDVSVAVS